MQATCAGHLLSASISPRTPGLRHMVLDSLGAPATVQGWPWQPGHISSHAGKPVGSGVAGVQSLWRLGICLVLRGLLLAT